VMCYAGGWFIDMHVVGYQQMHQNLVEVRAGTSAPIRMELRRRTASVLPPGSSGRGDVEAERIVARRPVANFLAICRSDVCRSWPRRYWHHAPFGPKPGISLVPVPACAGVGQTICVFVLRDAAVLCCSCSILTFCSMAHENAQRHRQLLVT
jgi:hypothetical protein